MKTRYSLSQVAGAGLTNVSFLAAQSLLFVVLTPLVLGSLGEDSYGIWIILQSILGFSSVANFKLGISANKFIAQYIHQPENKATIDSVVSINFLISFILGSAMAAFLFGIQGWLVSQIDGGTVTAGSLERIFFYIGLSIVPIFLSEISLGILFGLLKFGVGNSVLLGHQAVLWVGVWVIGLFDLDFTNVGLLIFAVNVSRFVISSIIAYRILKPTLSLRNVDRSLFREIFSFTRMNWLGAVGMLLFNSLDKVVVGITLNATSAGVYGIATGIGQKVSQLVDQSTQALIPYASNRIDDENRSEISRVTQTVQRLAANLIALISAILVIWMPQILAIWISPEFSAKYSFLFQLIVLCYGLFSLFRPAHKISTGLGWVTFPNLVILATAVTMITVLFFASKEYGLLGAVLSNFVFVGLLLVNFYIAVKLKEGPFAFVIGTIWHPMVLLGLFAYAAIRYGNPQLSLILTGAFLLLLLVTQLPFVLRVMPELKKSLLVVFSSLRIK